jgi:hypothetical protein
MFLQACTEIWAVRQKLQSLWHENHIQGPKKVNDTFCYFDTRLDFAFPGWSDHTDFQTNHLRVSSSPKPSWGQQCKEPRGIRPRSKASKGEKRFLCYPQTSSCKTSRRLVDWCTPRISQVMLVGWYWFSYKHEWRQRDYTHTTSVWDSLKYCRKWRREHLLECLKITTYSVDKLGYCSSP